MDYEPLINLLNQRAEHATHLSMQELNEHEVVVQALRTSDGKPYAYTLPLDVVRRVLAQVIEHPEWEG
jgi:hypothetical protein